MSPRQKLQGHGRCSVNKQNSCFIYRKQQRTWLKKKKKASTGYRTANFIPQWMARDGDTQCFHSSFREGKETGLSIACVDDSIKLKSWKTRPKGETNISGLICPGVGRLRMI